MALFAHKAIPGLGDDSSIEVNDEMLRVKDGGLSTAKLADSSVTEAKAGSALAAGITTGLVACKVIATTQLEALLDSSVNNLFAVKTGDVILNMTLYVGTAAGSTCVVDTGPDTAAGGSADPNGILTAANANAAGKYSVVDSVTDATAHTYSGDLMDDGPITIAADGFITIAASTDQSSSSFVGQIVMYYIPA